MSESELPDVFFFKIKIIQGGRIKRIELTEQVLITKFRDVLNTLTKELKLKLKNIFLSNPSGQMLSDWDYNSPVSEIVEKFGKNLNLYNEGQF